MKNKKPIVAKGSFMKTNFILILTSALNCAEGHLSNTASFSAKEVEILRKSEPVSSLEEHFQGAGKNITGWKLADETILVFPPCLNTQSYIAEHPQIQSEYAIDSNLAASFFYWKYHTKQDDQSQTFNKKSGCPHLGCLRESEYLKSNQLNPKQFTISDNEQPTPNSIRFGARAHWLLIGSEESLPGSGCSENQDETTEMNLEKTEKADNYSQGEIRFQCQNEKLEINWGHWKGVINYETLKNSVFELTYDSCDTLSAKLTKNLKELQEPIFFEIAYAAFPRVEKEKQEDFLKSLDSEEFESFKENLPLGVHYLKLINRNFQSKVIPITKIDETNIDRLSQSYRDNQINLIQNLRNQVRPDDQSLAMQIESIQNLAETSNTASIIPMQRVSKNGTVTYPHIIVSKWSDEIEPN
jgi:hypothetical protein